MATTAFFWAQLAPLCGMRICSCQGPAGKASPGLCISAWQLPARCCNAHHLPTDSPATACSAGTMRATRMRCVPGCCMPDAVVQLLTHRHADAVAPPDCSTFIKYVLSSIDTYMEGRWEQKGIYVFYLQLLTDLLHLFVYLVFFTITFANYGLPLHLVSCCATSAQACEFEPGHNVLGASLLQTCCCHK